MKIILISLIGCGVLSEELICESVPESWGQVIVEMLNENVDNMDFVFSLVPLSYEIEESGDLPPFDFEQLTIFDIK